MTDFQYNRILALLLDNAKKLGDTQNEAVTAERFIVAVIDFVSGKEGSENDQEQRLELMTILSNNLPFSSDKFTDVKADLLVHINDKTAKSFIDSIYMQQQIKRARDLALKNNQNELFAHTLLKSIFENPNEFIKGYLDARNDRAKREAVEKKDRLLLAFEQEQKASDSNSSEAIKGSEELQEKESAKKACSKRSIAELTARVKGINDSLSEAVLGQENAVNVFTSGFFQAELLSMTDKGRTRPRATFLFVGPPGVGKTFLAEKAAEALGLPFMRFDMSEYCDHEASVEFIGSDAIYKDAKQGNFTSFVSKNQKSVILFDEIEKAHISIIHLFLQILDAGRIRDNKTDEEISLADTILIFTTNAGKQLYEKSETGDFSGVSRKVILKALMNDINPETKQPYFPPAICSRFASGNVVMFNRISAYHLRQIAKREVLRHANSFEKEIGIKIDIDEQVYSALLFAEGGSADARTMRSRGETFIDTELYELFRLLSPEKAKNRIEKLESISISLELPDDNTEIRGLFESSEGQCVMIVTSRQTAECCKKACPSVDFVNVQSVSRVKKAMHDNDISFALIDLSFGRNGRQQNLNLEDVNSTARDIFWSIRGNFAGLPVYILQNDDNELNTEERRSFLRLGVRGFVNLSDNNKKLNDSLMDISEMIHQQKSTDALARANKLITFETSQKLIGRGKKAVITLFDFETAVAVDAEDSSNVLSNVSKPDVRFDQIIGAENAKEELKFFIEYLKNPRKFLGSGVEAPKGVLLYGPPGTGKTMLAKAMACEAGVTFIAAEGNQFIKKYVGEGKDYLQELFAVARKYSPSILFIDEFEAIAKERKGGDHAAANGEDVLTRLLTEMDGFNTDITKPVFVLAATNFDVNPGSSKSLDQAVLRRFDSRICVDLPDKSERIRFIRMIISGKEIFNISEDEIENIAIRSTGMSLAKLKNIFNLAMRMAIKTENVKISDSLLDEAFESFTDGEEKKLDASQLERTARHEAGHTFICWHSGEKPSYVTIVARDDHGGYMQHSDSEGKGVYTKEELLAKIRTSLGGRAAEIVYYGEKDGLSTGVSGDLFSATRIAKSMVCSYGMDDGIGLAVIDQHESQEGEVSLAVREAVNKVLSNQMKIAVELINSNRAAIDALVEALMSKNHLSGNDINQILLNTVKDKKA